jgi:hypothetical protein
MPRGIKTVFVSHQSQPMDIRQADTVKVFKVNGFWFGNIKTGSRGVKGQLGIDIPANSPAIAKAMGSAWRDVSEAGRNYFKFVRV